MTSVVGDELILLIRIVYIYYKIGKLSMKKCDSCGGKIEEDSGKLIGSTIKVKDENGEKKFVYACSNCMKDKDWIERAVVRAA
jgi:hypothetical protein